MERAPGFLYLWLLAGVPLDLAANACSGDACPEQRHLSFGRTPETMVVMWVTPKAVKQPTCEIGHTERMETQVPGTSTKIWQIGGITEVSHVCQLSLLVPGKTYFYRVGDNASASWSDTASFVARPNTTSWAPTILVYGDLGAENDVSLPSLRAEAASGNNDFVLHVGDFSYDFDTKGGEVGRAFMRNIDPIASRLPYMTCIGNHEGGTDLDHKSSLYHYMHRFQMPGRGDLVHGSKGNNVYYSFDAGPAHIVAFSSEAYFWQLWETKAQFEFLKADLESVDRSKTPWLITMAHRPMYCSNTDGDDCTKAHSNMRTGLPILGARLYKLEELFREHRVDLALWAHEHTYERTWPVFDNQVMNGSTSPYVDPGATVHIVSGNAGCREKHDHFKGPRGDWSAVRSETYGYGKLQVLNSSHLWWRQYNAENGTLVDEVMVVRTDAYAAHTAAKQTLFRDRVFEDTSAEQMRRESIYARTQGCTARGTLPQNDCLLLRESPSQLDLLI